MKKILHLPDLFIGSPWGITPATEVKKTWLASIRKAFFLLLISFITFSCQQDDSKVVTPAAEDPNWIRLEIPSGREAYAIAGDIDKTLLVTTWTKAYYTTDGGKTWQESKDFQGPVPGLLVRNDTTFSLKASGQDQSGQPFASLAQYFTADYGRTWKDCAHHYNTQAGYQFYSSLRKLIGVVQSSNGITYRIKHNVTPTSAGATSYYINPSELQKLDDFGVHTLPLPNPHKLLNLHLDGSNRLYVAASGGTFTKENIHYCCEEKSPAIIYVSRKPLP